MNIQTIKTNQLKPHPKNESVYGSQVDQEFLDNVKQYGIIDRLIVTNDYTILSGHRRWLACKKLEIEKVEIEISKLTDPLDQLEYLLNANKQRVKDEEMKTREYKIYKEIEEERLRVKLSEIKKGNENASKTTRPNLDELNKEIKPERSDVISAEKVGMKKSEAHKKEFIVDMLDEVREESEDAGKVLKYALENESTESAFKLAKEVKENKEETIKKLETINVKLESGEVKTVKDAVKEQKKEERAIEEKKQFTQTEINNEFISIHNLDFREYAKNIKDNSIDLILTDPPYPSEFLPLWKDLSMIAKRILKSNGFLIAYSGQLHLNKVMNYLDENLSYYWMFSLKHTGGNQLIHARNIFCGWKPILVYQKEIKKVDFQIEDFITGSGREKELHEWQQSEIEIYDIINRFTKPGNVIFDPFLGSGTTGSACVKLKRKIVGCEIDKTYFEKCKMRIYNEFKRPL